MRRLAAGSRGMAGALLGDWVWGWAGWVLACWVLACWVLTGLGAAPCPAAAPYTPGCTWPLTQPLNPRPRPAPRPPPGSHQLAQASLKRTAQRAAAGAASSRAAKPRSEEEELALALAMSMEQVGGGGGLAGGGWRGAELGSCALLGATACCRWATHGRWVCVTRTWATLGNAGQRQPPATARRSPRAGPAGRVRCRHRGL